MLSKILTAALFFTLIGCESKEYKKEENSGISYAESLNQGKNEALIQELNSKSSLTSRERYYLASAHSGAGGIDVYSLYSVLEIQLFRKNALEWKDLSKEQNPYLKFMKSQQGVDYEKRRKKREARWEKDYLKISQRRGWKNLKKPEGEDPSGIEWEKEYKAVMEMRPDAQSRYNAWSKVTDKAFRSGEANEVTFAYYDYYSQLVEEETAKQNYIYPEGKTYGGFNNVQWEMVYMNVLWNTYEAIPILKKLPQLTSQNQDEITKSLEEYRKLVKDEKFKEVSLKNTLVLSAVSLLSIYKESFDFDDVVNMQDLLCNFDPKVLTDNYELIRKRLIFMAEVMKDADKLGSLKEYESKIEELQEVLPETLTEEQKTRYLDGYENFKLGTCYNG